MKTTALPSWHVKTTPRDVFHFIFPGLLLIVLTACGGGGSSPAPAEMPMTSSTYTIGGTVTGLPSGSSLVLQNNAGDDLAVSHGLRIYLHGCSR